jgi:hypothetical protein
MHAISGDAATQALSHIKDLQVVGIRHKPAHERLKRFKASYVPQSKADIEYEALCMWRWIVIADYFDSLMQQRGLVNYVELWTLTTSCLTTLSPLIRR